MDLLNIKDKIESLPRQYHSEIARLLMDHNTPYNENSNGMFVNLSLLSPEVLTKVVQYISYLDLQERQLSADETQKVDLKETFFT